MPVSDAGDDAVLFGVLGGMGPLATVDLLQKIIEETPAERDQEHVPVVAWNVPQIPDRQKALAGTGISPLPVLLSAIRELNRLPVSHIVIPCNTAHHCFDALAEHSRAPLIHIVDAVVDEVRQGASGENSASRVGLIATRGTLDAGWYQQRLAALGIETVTPDEREMESLFVPGCYTVKRGAVREGGELLNRLAERLAQRGAGRMILACTEVAPALRAVDSPWQQGSVDSGGALARACVRIWLAARQSALSRA